MLIPLILTSVVAILVIAGVVFSLIKNTLHILQNRLKEAFSEIDAQLKYRNDLIPSLVESVKNSFVNERSMLETVISARNAASTATQNAATHPEVSGNMKALAETELLLQEVIKNFIVKIESIPDFRSNTHLTQLIEKLRSTQLKIVLALEHYNDFVKSYNRKRSSFPIVIIANLSGYQSAEPLEFFT